MNTSSIPSTIINARVLRLPLRRHGPDPLLGGEICCGWTQNWASMRWQWWAAGAARIRQQQRTRMGKGEFHAEKGRVRQWFERCG
jgi:hypothetical protein